MKAPKDILLFDPSEFLTKALTAYTHDLSLDGYQFREYHETVRDLWLTNFKKKFLLPGDRADRENKAFAKFLAVNEEMRLFNLGPFIGASIDTYNIIEKAKHLIRHIIGPSPALGEVALEAKNSAGTSIGVPYWDTSPERKFQMPISMTQSVKPLWDAYILWDKDLAHAIYCVNESIGNFSDETIFTEGSRGCTVPKTNDIDRFISVEAVGNMFFQHGTSKCLETCLNKIGLNFDEDPEKHRLMAFLGSIHNRIATVDFSSMSDRVSLGLCQFMLPHGWYELLINIRSPKALIQGEWVELHMISTMGNATTFPLQTLILWALAVSVAQSYHKTPKKIPLLSSKSSKKIPWTHNISVFGDDCIMPTQYVERFLEVCQACGFVPNPDKSYFKEEFFRESCGGDFYHGRDVRPLFLASFPTHQNKRNMEAYLYSTINNVITKYKSYFGVVSYLYEKSFLRFLFDALMRVTDKVLFVPHDFPNDSGVTSMPDIARFIQHYRIVTSPIGVDKNGMLSFSYLRYQYSREGRVDDQLRYALRLKKLMTYKTTDVIRHPLDDVLKKVAIKRNIRKRGTYVLSKSKGKSSMTTPTTMRKPRV